MILGVKIQLIQVFCLTYQSTDLRANRATGDQGKPQEARKSQRGEPSSA